MEPFEAPEFWVLPDSQIILCSNKILNPCFFFLSTGGKKIISDGKPKMSKGLSSNKMNKYLERTKQILTVNITITFIMLKNKVELKSCYAEIKKKKQE